VRYDIRDDPDKAKRKLGLAAQKRARRARNRRLLIANFQHREAQKLAPSLIIPRF